MRSDVAELVTVVRRSAGLSQRDLAQRSGVAASTIARIELARIDTTIGTLEKLVRACDAELIVSARQGTRSQPWENGMSIEAPTTYPYPAGRPPSNLWDHDAVSWLLENADVAARFTYLSLYEHLRRQKRLTKHAPDRVEEAAQLARKYGVILQNEYDPKIGKSVIRLYRTDPARPRYPGNAPAAARRDQ